MDYNNNPRISFDEQGNMYVDGVVVKVKNIVFEDKKSMDIAYRDLKNSFDVGAVSAETFYSELEALRDYYLEDGSAAWWKYTRQILSYEQSLVEEQKEIQERMRQEEIDKRMTSLSALYSLGEINAQQYYDGLEKIRDEFFEKDSSEWQSYTVTLGEFYKNQLDNAMEKSENLADRLFGSIMHHYTIKDQNGNITDSFYRLISPDSRTAEKYLEGYNFLAENGAPGFVLNDYLSKSPNEASEVLRIFRELGSGLPSYFESISETYAQIKGMTNQFFGTEDLKTAVSDIIAAIKEVGDTDSVEITQNFYGNNISPSEISRETENTLKLQGVNL